MKEDGNEISENKTEVKKADALSKTTQLRETKVHTKNERTNERTNK